MRPSLKNKAHLKLILKEFLHKSAEALGFFGYRIHYRVRSGSVVIWNDPWMLHCYGLASVSTKKGPGCWHGLLPKAFLAILSMRDSGTGTPHGIIFQMTTIIKNIKTMHVGTYVLVCEHACGGQRLMLSVFIYSPSHSFFFF